MSWWMPEGWAGRVRKDLAASAPDEPGPVTEGHLPGWEREMLERDFLSRVPHEYLHRASAAHLSPRCVCGGARAAAVHWGEGLLDTQAWLDESPPPPATVRAGDGKPACGDGTPSFGTVIDALRAAALPDREQEQEPPATPLRARPAPEPGGVLGYNVASLRTGGSVGWLVSSDLMSREHAEHALEAAGGVLVEIRAARQ